MHRLVLLLVMIAACGSAKAVQRTEYGGVIALDGDRTKAMEQANQLMAQHCGPGNFQVLHEGVASAASGGHANEWRITYQCGNGAGAPPVTPPPAVAPSPPPPP